MGNTGSSEGVEWMWNSSSEPFSKTQPPQWRRYTDVECMIIEEAYQTSKKQAILDNYYIDMQKRVQISKNDMNKQRPIKRMISTREEIYFREERFITNPIESNRTDSGLYGFISPFIFETVKYLKLIRDGLPSKNPSIVTMIVDKAVQGIFDEGEKLAKQQEAKILAKRLSGRREAGIREVWKCCVYLYSLESFLYKIINETLRSIGSNEHDEQIWQDRVSTLGPFCLLLWDNPFDNKPIKAESIVYRGAQVLEEFITTLKTETSLEPRPNHSFQAFLSCTRNRTVAERFGNTLFIMKIRVAFSIDLRSFSKYPHEEEEVLLPGLTFIVHNVEFDTTTKKHLVTLILQQKHNRNDLNQLKLTPANLVYGDATPPDEDEGKYDRFEYIIHRSPFTSMKDFKLPTFLDRLRSLDPDELKFFRENTNIGEYVDDVLRDDEIALSRVGLDDDWKIE